MTANSRAETIPYDPQRALGDYPPYSSISIHIEDLSCVWGCVRTVEKHKEIGRHLEGSLIM